MPVFDSLVERLGIHAMVIAIVSINLSVLLICFLCFQLKFASEEDPARIEASDSLIFIQLQYFIKIFYTITCTGNCSRLAVC